jgi:release factor glutamine methyltransferase
MAEEQQVWTVKRLLEWTAQFFARKNVDSPRLSGEMLLAFVLGVPRVKLYTDYGKVLGEGELARFRELVRRAGAQEPIAYLTGMAPFFNLDLVVSPAVLIPRPDTETLVENVVQLVRAVPGFEAPRVLDVCTGSGCIGLAVARAVKGAVVVGTDISEAALEVARGNAARLGLAERVVFLHGDLYEALAGTAEAQPFDLVLSNPPYIPSGDIADLDASVRDFEPRIALDGGTDGLSVIRRVIEGARDRLRPGGRVYVETQFDQGERVLELAAECEWLDDVRILRDAAGHQRVMTGRRV